MLRTRTNEKKYYEINQIFWPKILPPETIQLPPKQLNPRYATNQGCFFSPTPPGVDRVEVRDQRGYVNVIGCGISVEIYDGVIMMWVMWCNLKIAFARYRKWSF